MRSKLFAGLLIVWALLMVGCQREVSPPSSAATLQALKEVGKLDLVEVSTEEIFVISGSGHTLYSIRTLEDASEFFDDLMRFGGRTGVYSFTNYSVAYLELGELTPEDVSIDGEAVTLVLPPIRIEPIGRSGTLTKLHERVSGSKTPITNAERTEMQNKASALAKERLSPDTDNYKSIVQQAEAKAIAFFTGYLHSRGYDKVSVMVERSAGE